MAKQREFKELAREYYKLLAQADWKPPRKTSGIANLFSWLFSLIAVAAILVFLYIMWPAVVARYTGTQPAAPLAPATAVIRSQPASAPDVPRTVATPIPGLAQNEATATAQYNEAVQRSQNGAVILPANDPQPVQLIQQPAERQPAGDNVPTAEPVEAGAPVVNIQQTHECKHGQQWTDAGCKNPDGKGTKVRP